MGSIADSFGPGSGWIQRETELQLLDHQKNADAERKEEERRKQERERNAQKERERKEKEKKEKEEADKALKTATPTPTPTGGSEGMVSGEEDLNKIPPGLRPLVKHVETLRKNNHRLEKENIDLRAKITSLGKNYKELSEISLGIFSRVSNLLK